MNWDVFIATGNYQRTETAKNELLAQMINVGIVLVLGRAGRGKTTVVQRIATLDRSVVYLPFKGWITPTGILREICFSVAGERPRTAQACFDKLQTSFGERKYALAIDESDRMTLKHLNILRDLHDNCGIGLILVGEEPLRSLVARERRLISRVSQEISFQGVGAPDVSLYYQKALDLGLTPGQAANLAKHSQGDFRLVVRDALSMDRMMRTSGLNTVTDELVSEVCKGR